MNNLVVMYVSSNSQYIFEPCFNKESAFDFSFKWALQVPNAKKILFLCSDSDTQKIKKNTAQSPIPTHIIQNDFWTACVLMQTLSEQSKEYDSIIYGFAECPFYSKELTAQMLETKEKYGAEYVFADGYPLGITPEILHNESCAIISHIAKDDDSPVKRDTIFSILKKDINLFEIETLIAPKDLRYLRLDFSCASKRDTERCKAFFNQNQADLGAENICAVAEKSADIQRTLPAFYNIQIASRCSGLCGFCPYPSQYESEYGMLPQQSSQIMPIALYNQLVQKIADFSNDAVISLSLWGEALLHPHIIECVKSVLDFPSLSLLIETDGTALTQELAQQIAKVTENSLPRTNGNNPVNWIVSLDSCTAQKYEELHGQNNFDKATEAIQILLPLFNKSVYPQFLRMNQNEEQLEQFYRYWKEKTQNVIIQKYDWFSGILPQKKVADLTPLEREPCKHLCRDMCILLDGTVPRCKASFFKNDYGNVFKESLPAIWQRGKTDYEAQIKRSYKGLCKDCDEYYTFNF